MIYAKWLRTLRYGNDYFKLIEPQAYYLSYSAYIRRILHDSICEVRLAVLSDNHDVVLGFCVHRGRALDYIYVQKESEMRGKGIGTKLLPRDIDTITHVTKTGLLIWANKYGHWKFNPFL